MTGGWWIALALALGSGLFFLIGCFVHEGIWLISGALALAFFLFGIGMVVRDVGHHYDVAACSSFGEQSNREVKFVDYTYWSWDCLTPTTDGKWISTSRLRDLDGDDG